MATLISEILLFILFYIVDLLLDFIELNKFLIFNFLLLWCFLLNVIVLISSVLDKCFYIILLL